MKYIKNHPECRFLYSWYYKVKNKKDKLRKPLRFKNEKYLYSQDWDMWLRLSKYFHGHCFKKPLSKYYYHDNNRSSKKVDRYHKEIKKSILNLYGWDKNKLRQLKKNYGK